MKNIFMGIQVFITIALILSILPQDTKSAAPSQMGGGGGETSQAYFKPKGKDAVLGRLTKIAAFAFFVNAVILILLQK